MWKFRWFVVHKGKRMLRCVQDDISLGKRRSCSIAEFLVCGDSEAFSILGADEVQLRVPPLRVAPVKMTGLEGGSKVFARATV